MPRTLAATIARDLNAHQMKTLGGFYSSFGRGFLARAKGETLQVSLDFETYIDVPTCTKFWTHNGRTLATCPCDDCQKRNRLDLSY